MLKKKVGKAVVAKSALFAHHLVSIIRKDYEA